MVFFGIFGIPVDLIECSSHINSIKNKPYLCPWGGFSCQDQIRWSFYWCTILQLWSHPWLPDVFSCRFYFNDTQKRLWISIKKSISHTISSLYQNILLLLSFVKHVNNKRKPKWNHKVTVKKIGISWMSYAWSIMQCIPHSVCILDTNIYIESGNSNAPIPMEKVKTQLDEASVKIMSFYALLMNEWTL